MGPRYEDPTDVERRRARDFGHVTVGDGFTNHSWFLEDEQTAVEIIVRADGEICAYLEDFSDE